MLPSFSCPSVHDEDGKKVVRLNFEGNGPLFGDRTQEVIDHVLKQKIKRVKVF